MIKKKTYTKYNGYFLLDTGQKIEFDLYEGETCWAKELYNGDWTFIRGETIWLESIDCYILVDRIIGFICSEYQEE